MFGSNQLLVSLESLSAHLRQLENAITLGAILGNNRARMDLLAIQQVTGATPADAEIESVETLVDATMMILSNIGITEDPLNAFSSEFSQHHRHNSRGSVEGCFRMGCYASYFKVAFPFLEFELLLDTVAVC